MALKIHSRNPFSAVLLVFFHKSVHLRCNYQLITYNIKDHETYEEMQFVVKPSEKKPWLILTGECEGAFEGGFQA